MENKIIAEALLEIAKERSETTIIEISAEDKELIKAAKKLGIVLPSPDLSVMKTTYAEIGKVNKNGVILPKKAVEDGLPTLLGKQVNFEHEGSGRICGYIIDASIEGDLIHTISVIFKSLFPEEMEVVKERFKNKELAVSFEIWNKDQEGNSVVKELSNGYREMTKIVFHGQGLLLSSPPACPKAKVFKMLAKEILNAEKIVDKVFNEDLVYAQLAIEEPKCKNCGTCNCDKKEDSKVDVLNENDYEGSDIDEAKKLTTEQRNALPDSDFALIQEKDGKKIRRFPINDEAHVRNALARLPQAKDISEEEKKSALAKILKKAKELNMTELLQKYEKSEETPAIEVKPEETATKAKPEVVEPVVEVKPEEAKVEPEVKPEEVKVEAQAEEITPISIINTTVEEMYVTVSTPKADGIGNEVSKKGKRKTTCKFSDGTEQISEEEFEVVNKFTQAEIDEQLNSAKIESQKLVDNKDIEIKTLTEAKDKEISNLKQELDSKNQEIEKSKTVEVAVIKKQIDLDVGAVEANKEDKFKKIHDEVDKKAFKR